MRWNCANCIPRRYVSEDQREQSYSVLGAYAHVLPVAADGLGLSRKLISVGACQDRE